MDKPSCSWAAGLTKIARVLRTPTAYLTLWAVLFVCLVLYYDAPYVLIDDAYISFRYAENLAQGRGLVFNPGERVEGYTNFLWIVLLSGAVWVGSDIEVASKLLATLAGISVIFCLYLLARSLSIRSLWLAPLLFVSMGCHARYAVSGMETLLFVALLCWGVYAFFAFHQRSFPLWVTGLIFAAASMARPEGIMYFSLICQYQIVASLKQRRLLRNLVPLLIGFSLVYLPYTLWRLSYYGYLFPNTYYAKVGPLSWLQINRGLSLLAWLIARWNLLPLAAFVPLALVGRSRTPHRLLMLAIVFISILYFVCVGGDFVVWFGPRFLMPAIPWFLLLVTMGLQGLESPFSSDRGWKRTLANWACGVILAIWLMLYTWPGPNSALRSFRVQMQGWAELGRWINSHTPPSAVIATDAAGLIPFYSKRAALDMFGLTNTHIAHLPVANMGAGTAGHEKFDPHFVLAQEPDYIVSTWLDEYGNAVSAGLAAVREELNARYRLIAVAKVANEAPKNGEWVLAVSTYSPDLYQRGYRTGLFKRVVGGDQQAQE